MHIMLMITREIWLNKLLSGWSERTIVWLSGVRRVGKTTLARMVPQINYYNCDLPSTVRAVGDPELFLSGCQAGSVIALDEIHRLPDPSLLLKIAADEYPHLKVLATGSSTLAATGKFRDALTGRKRSIYLCPVLWEECAGPFRMPDLDHRLLHGGMPESLLADTPPSLDFAEWIDSFYARDILELFNVRNRRGFLSLFRLLLRGSGGQIGYGRLSRLTELSRPTVRSYIAALETAHAIHLLRPFRGGGTGEIVSRPKCYAFDTGFVAYEKGWHRIREEDRGLLWEHLVLDSLRFRYSDNDIFYWRDKNGREIDFVVRRGVERLDTFECKINPSAIHPVQTIAFRRRYPVGRDHVIIPVVPHPYQVRRGGRVYTVCGTRHLSQLLASS